MEAENKDINIKVIQSVWRRMKNGHIKVRDLQPEKDVKGGGGVAGKSKPITDGTGTTTTLKKFWVVVGAKNKLIKGSRAIRL